jgi:hypothetical protein
MIRNRASQNARSSVPEELHREDKKESRRIEELIKRMIAVNTAYYKNLICMKLNYIYLNNDSL